MQLTVVVGARPHVVKVSPLLPALERAGIGVDVAFTGSRSAEHPEDSGAPMSFYGLDIEAPRWFLDVGVGTDAVETGRAMMAFEDLFARERPDAVLVVGDVNTTLAASLSAVKSGIPVVHLGAGLRCADLRVPEEINRVLISRIASMHLAPTERALENLEDEGVDPERIHFVGSIGSESVFRHLESIVDLSPADEFGLATGEYVVAVFHRPENLGDETRTLGILGGIAHSPLPVLIADTNTLTAAADRFGRSMPAAARVADAVPYLTMLALIRDAACVITDSSGVQEEACTIGTACVTVRECTELTVTLESEANRLVYPDPDEIRAALIAAAGIRKGWNAPKRWDRAVSERVVRALKRGITPLQ